MHNLAQANNLKRKKPIVFKAKLKALEVKKDKVQHLKNFKKKTYKPMRCENNVLLPLNPTCKLHRVAVYEVYQ